MADGFALPESGSHETLLGLVRKGSRILSDLRPLEDWRKADAMLQYIMQ